MKSLMPKSKRSQSDIIATLLIVLLVIISAGVLLRFLIPYLIGLLSSGDCFEYNGKIEIVNDPVFTCYNSTTKTLYLKVGLGDIDENAKNKITGFNFVLISGGNSYNYEMIPPGSNPAGISLLTGDVAGLPLKNQERAYKIDNITTKPDSVIVYPFIDKKRKCAETQDTMNFIPNCTKGFISLSSNADKFISGGEIPVVPSYQINNDLYLSNIPPETKSLILIVENTNDTTPHGAYYYDNPLLDPMLIDVGAAVWTQAELYSSPTAPPPRKINYYTFSVYAMNQTIDPSLPLTKPDLINRKNELRTLGKAILYGKITGV